MEETNSMDIPSFGSLVENRTLDGDKVKIEDILNKEIIITGYNITDSKYKDRGSGFCVKVQFHFVNDTVNKVFFSGSNVLKEQIEKVKKVIDEKQLPFLFKSTVKKIGNYYSLV